MKLSIGVHLCPILGRTPHGVRGLKSFGGGQLKKIYKSHPTRGAWIEIGVVRKN